MDPEEEMNLCIVISLSSLQFTQGADTTEVDPEEEMNLCIFISLSTLQYTQGADTTEVDPEEEMNLCIFISLSTLQYTQGADTTEVDPEEEMGLAGAAAEDAEAEYIRKLTETELVNSSHLLAVISPLLITVCNNQVKYSDPNLRAAASLALAKFMMVR